MDDDLICDELKKEWLGKIAAETVPDELFELALRLQDGLGHAPAIDTERAGDYTPVN